MVCAKNNCIYVVVSVVVVVVTVAIVVVFVVTASILLTLSSSCCDPQTSEGGLFSSKPLMSMASKAKKMVANSSRNILRRCHGVGAVGYAVVMADERIPPNDFFIQGRRFRLRFR